MDRSVARARVAVDGARPRATRATDPSRHLSCRDRGDRPVAETRADVATPVPLVTLARRRLTELRELSQSAATSRQRYLATTRIGPLTEAKPPPLILLPGDRISLALEHASGDLPPVKLHAGAVPYRPGPQRVALDTHHATSAFLPLRLEPCCQVAGNPHQTTTPHGGRREAALLAQPPDGQHRDAQPLGHFLDCQQLDHLATMPSCRPPGCRKISGGSSALRLASIKCGLPAGRGRRRCAAAACRGAGSRGRTG